ncbi:acyl-CoA-binding domain-containing protein 5-like isoform X2 [Zingiber officinale]|uniref:acyl-CoA-binding domain-containing protein 5-like isoform X2 n=1 Tax=Zingiber officinale TaxID=94328 RepID=UPI001C4BD1F5|nr:acyl-CoA-binding domain-containing protein 5-like isoform X2 [Zingiber officinale]
MVFSFNFRLAAISSLQGDGRWGCDAPIDRAWTSDETSLQAQKRQCRARSGSPAMTLRRSSQISGESSKQAKKRKWQHNVWSIDLENSTCSFVETFGKHPRARGGQSTTLIDSKLFMFGGEDRKRNLLNDLYTLDLSTTMWEEIETKNASPAPRFDHSAAVYADQYILIFGDSSHSICFKDLHLLDLRTMEWSRPQTQGAYVTPRGGHASTIVEDNWYIVGGGDNISGATETIALNISKLVWSITTSVGKRDPLASEVFVLKIKPKEPTLPRLLQSRAAAAGAASVTAAYAIITGTDEENVDLRKTVGQDIKSNHIENSQKLSAIDSVTLKAENKVLESRIMEIRHENLRLQTKIDEMDIVHTELLKAQISQIQKSQESCSSLKHEFDVLRHQKSQVAQEMVVAQKQKSGGVWQ